ncbi:MAG: hypothetical protein KDI19_04660 [Pseudomonadales bacterium]|nr:hypothetical protein [Pseudomonadales bacterium]
MSALTSQETPIVGWKLVRTQAGDVLHPGALDMHQAIDDAIVPGTAAQTWLREHPGETAPNTDDFDWWYVTEITGTAPATLIFDGLATLAEVWLDDECVLHTANMFRRYHLPIAAADGPRRLALAFRSMTRDLSAKRKRPGWKTNLVDHQQLRWRRTTLLGRIPGWTPPVPAVGPWRPVRLATGITRPQRCLIMPRVDSQGQHLDVRLEAALPDGVVPTSVFVDIASEPNALAFDIVNGNLVIDTSVTLATPLATWHPHTHGDPTSHEVVVRLVQEDEGHTLFQGRLGWRSTRFERDGDDIALLVNDQRVFCRGACWTTPDIVSLDAPLASIERTLTLMRDAGANMIRLGGTMVYESDAFYETCDKLGLMVWQDFMFANMDYPVDDPEFEAEVREEIFGQVARLAPHPCLAVFCGNSEVEQQAAMFGLPADAWRSRLFYDVIPAVLDACGAPQPYVPASPSEGHLPFHTRTGFSHYFGVGAYRRPVDDVRAAQVRFTSECLGFSNVPGDPSLQRHFGTRSPAVHTPAWKNGVPRDNAAGWDFEDIRDHYLAELFGVDAIDLRYADKAGYIQHAQVVSGEVMRRTFAYWRSRESQCGGGIVWFLKDLVPGAGWGLIDSDNEAKPALQIVSRAWRSVGLQLLDSGMDGIDVSLLNESAQTLTGSVHVTLLRHAQVPVGKAERAISVSPWSSELVSVDEILGRFHDTGYHYRFGPPAHDVVLASWLDEDGNVLGTDAWFPSGYRLQPLSSASVELTARETPDGAELTLVVSDGFLQFVTLRGQGLRFNDNYFHLLPGVPHTVHATREVADAKLTLTLAALNLTPTLTLKAD